MDDVTEFKFKCCGNPTIFPHPNPSDVQRQFSLEFECGFALRNSKLLRVPGLQKDKHEMGNNKLSHTHCIKNEAGHVEQPAMTGKLNLESAELS